MRRASAAAAAIAATLGASAQGAAAAAFGLIEHGASGLGNAYAGGAAIAADPTTVFFNPAGMTRLPGTRVALAINYVNPKIDFHNDGSSVQAGPLPAAPIRPGPGDSASGSDAGNAASIPNAYLTHALSEQVTLGLAIDAPFGLVTQYDSGWVGRYHAIKSDLRTINLNPAVAVKLDHGFSVGAGVSALYTEVELTKSLDVCAGRPLALGGPSPGTCDARSKVSGDDWSFGYNLGLLYELDDRTRFGIAYRKWMKPHVEGDGKFNFSSATPPQMLPALTAPSPPGLGLVDGTDASASVPLPDSVSISAFHALTPEWAVMADVSWTHWSVVDTIRIDFDSGAESPLALDYKDSWRYSLGVAYTPGGGPLTWRVGFAYDEEPVRNVSTRTPRLPGNDRRWLAVGVGYRVSDALSLDFGYAHLFVSDTEIRNRESSGALTHTLTGDYKLAVDIVGAQLNWQFQ